MKRYLVITTRTAFVQKHVLKKHEEYLDLLRFNRQLYLAGHFSNKPGGAYIIWADSLESAQVMAQQDPINVSDYACNAVYEWTAH